MSLGDWVARNCRFAQGEQPALSLPPQEQKIFGFLMEVVRYIGQQTGKIPQLRVAGGWVRDKLMGQESDDIDVAIEAMTGAEFEHNMEQYAASYQRQHGQPHPALGKSYTVKANPEKSKHLETVAIQIYGQKIDFVNLRSESYGDSRIPTMEMGTPETDAARRDLTINSIFYNLNNGQIEDLTGMGMDDLKSMTLRTPLDPKQTFLDDPLRMLRVLRFYSRYPDSTIDPAIPQAMADPEVQKAYREKVSRERAGPELLKLLKGAKPADAMRVMFDTGLDKVAFDVPETQELTGHDGKGLRMDQQNKHHAHNVLDHSLLVLENMNQLSQQEGLDDDTRMKMNLAAMFHDYGKAHPEMGQFKEKDPSERGYKGHEDKSVGVAEAILRHIGVGRQDRDFVSKVISLHMRPHTESWSKRTIGKFLRDSKIEGQEAEDMWRYVMLHGIADEMSKGTGDYSADVALKRQHMQQFQDYLDQPPPVQPLLDGLQIIGLFKDELGNPTLRPDTGYIKEVKTRLLAEQDAGTVTTPEQAQAFVSSIRQDIESRYGPQSPTIAWVQKNCKI